jgi:hypothetical protein
LDENQAKVFRVFLLAIHSHLQICLEISISSNSVKEKGGNLDRKPHSLPYDLRNPYRNFKSEKRTLKIMPINSKKLYVHEFGFSIVFS